MRVTIICATLAAMAAGVALQSQAQTADELLTKGREAFMNYEFDKAANLYAQAKKKVKRADEEFTERYGSYSRQLTEARNFLGRVEKIEVIDSITAPKRDFFRAYKLPASSGSLRGAEALPGRRVSGVDYVFTNEGEDYKLWSQPDSVGNMLPVESMLLADGSWSAPRPLWDDISEDSDAIYPFMMSDGVTLYYAGNGDESIGGYDIMVATRDAADGEFLQPQNMGFPYNSPYDDYLLAIDELNGVGWWATDRNQLDDDLTIYVFITNDLRTNYPSDEENLIGFARLDDYIMTQPEDADYDALLATIQAIDPSAREHKPEFYLPASKGRVFTRFDELPDARTRSAMKSYLSAKRDYDNTLSEIADLRRDYRQRRSAALGNKIAKAEALAEQQRAKVAELLNSVYKSL